jgi:hypothetical protein
MKVLKTYEQFKVNEEVPFDMNYYKRKIDEKDYLVFSTHLQEELKEAGFDEVTDSYAKMVEGDFLIKVTKNKRTKIAKSIYHDSGLNVKIWKDNVPYAETFIIHNMMDYNTEEEGWTTAEIARSKERAEDITLKIMSYINSALPFIGQGNDLNL